MTATPSVLVQAFLATGSLPLSRSISQVQAMLKRADYNACDLAEHLRMDPSLAARVMAVANSSFFSRQPCASIDDAVNRLGTVQLTRIFSQVLASAALIRPLRAYGLPADAIWRRSVFAAVGAELAAGRSGEDRSAAYMVGLLHQMGLLVAENLWERQTGAAKLAYADFETEYRSDERQLCGFDQAELGAELLRQLAFPASVVEAVGRQYLHPREPVERVLYIGRLVRACAYEVPTLEPHADILREFNLVATSHLEDFLADVREETQNLMHAA
jgi:HD-like signal output (HDOD) protein